MHIRAFERAPLRIPGRIILLADRNGGLAGWLATWSAMLAGNGKDQGTCSKNIGDKFIPDSTKAHFSSNVSPSLSLSLSFSIPRVILMKRNQKQFQTESGH